MAQQALEDTPSASAAKAASIDSVPSSPVAVSAAASASHVPAAAEAVSGTKRRLGRPPGSGSKRARVEPATPADAPVSAVHDDLDATVISVQAKGDTHVAATPGTDIDTSMVETPSASINIPVAARRVWAIFAAAHDRLFDQEFLDKLDSFSPAVIKQIAALWRQGQVSGAPDEAFARTSAVQALGLIGITIDSVLGAGSAVSTEANEWPKSATSTRRGPPRSNSISRVKADIVAQADSDLFSEELDPSHQEKTLAMFTKSAHKSPKQGKSPK
jgi:hypothetical protein